jgi:hypothetical protein
MNRVARGGLFVAKNSGGVYRLRLMSKMLLMMLKMMMLKLL